MNALSHQVLAPASSFALLTFVAALAVTGCSSVTPASGLETRANGLSAASSNVCHAKACGADCTPAGSDEPFNCDAMGQCIATGQPLGCEAGAGACPEFLGDCITGHLPADLDGDGCIDGCAPFVSGRVLFPQGWTPGAAPAEGVVEVLDVTLADAPSIAVGSTKIIAANGASLAFQVLVTKVVANRSYAVRVHIDTDKDHQVSKGDLITMESYPVLTNGYGTTTDVTVRPVP
jgi:hypothetical protein